MKIKRALLILGCFAFINLPDAELLGRPSMPHKVTQQSPLSLGMFIQLVRKNRGQARLTGYISKKAYSTIGSTVAGLNFLCVLPKLFSDVADARMILRSPSQKAGRSWLRVIDDQLLGAGRGVTSLLCDALGAVFI